MTTTENESIGEIASSVTSNFDDLAELITASSYAAGTAFAAASILEFKSHKDNPTQIPIGTPIALVVVAAALLFIPTIAGTGSSSTG